MMTYWVTIVIFQKVHLTSDLNVKIKNYIKDRNNTLQPYLMDCNNKEV